MDDNLVTEKGLSRFTMTQNDPQSADDSAKMESSGKAASSMEDRLKRLLDEWAVRLEARELSLIQKEAKLEALMADLPRLKDEMIPQWVAQAIQRQSAKQKNESETRERDVVSEFKRKMERMENDFRLLLEQIVQEEAVRNLEMAEPDAPGKKSRKGAGYFDKIKSFFKLKKPHSRRDPLRAPFVRQGSSPAQLFQDSKGDACTRIITVANQKGGCGKTTTCINLATGLAKKGYRVLIIDMDPQAHASLGLGIDVYNLEKSIYDVMIHDAPIPSVIMPTYQKNMDIVPASSVLTGAPLEMADLIGRESLLKMSLVKMLNEEPGKYEYILMDCSPSLDLLTINALVAAWRILVPIQAHYFSLEGMRELFSTIQIVRERYNPQLDVLGILPTIFDPTSSMSRQMLVQLSEYFHEKLLTSIIHVNMLLAEASAHGKSILDYAPDSNAADDNWGLIEEIVRLTYPAVSPEMSKSQKLGMSGISA